MAKMKITRKKLHHLYYLERKTTRQVAKELGIGQTSVRRWMRHFGMIARNSSESRIKHPRKSLSKNNMEKAYLLGLCAGDVSACKRTPFTVELTTSTTRPAMINLFYNVFGKYGHCIQWPRKSNISFQWALYCGLDKSFTFLLDKSLEVPKENNLFYSFLAGYTDAEGCWSITRSHDVRIFIRFLLTTGDLEILKKIKEKLENDGYNPRFRCIPVKNKYKSKKLRRTKTLYELSLYRKEEVVSLAKKLLSFSKHEEKIDKIKLILRIKNKKYWSEVESELKEFKKIIINKRDDCINKARSEYELRRIKSKRYLPSDN